MADNEGKISYREYWKEVEDLPKGIIDDLRSDGLRGDRLGEEARDRLHETVDGHQWIIYTAYYPWILMHSPNEDALFTEQGDQTATSYSQIMQVMAFYAFYQDVAEKMQEQLDNLDDEDEDED